MYIPYSRQLCRQADIGSPVYLGQKRLSELRRLIPTSETGSRCYTGVGRVQPKRLSDSCQGPQRKWRNRCTSSSGLQPPPCEQPGFCTVVRFVSRLRPSPLCPTRQTSSILPATPTSYTACRTQHITPSVPSSWPLSKQRKATRTRRAADANCARAEIDNLCHLIHRRRS